MKDPAFAWKQPKVAAVSLFCERIDRVFRSGCFRGRRRGGGDVGGGEGVARLT